MNITVLVVDDEKPLRDFVRRNLEVRGYRVLTASNGAAALDILRRETVDVLITDQRMPEMSGIELVATTERRYSPVGSPEK